MSAHAGIVESIHIVRARRGPPEAISEALLTPGRGLPGDHHDRPGVKRAITLIRAETLEDVAAKLGVSISPGASRRNVLVRGLPLDAMAPGTKLRLGEALVEVRGPCDPCERMERAIGPGAWALMEGRGGIFVRVLEGGRLRVGEALSSVSERAPVRHETGRQRALIEWFRTTRRDLPWRRTRDPYAIWISEVMLQQTRVDTAIPYFVRFLARFPTVETLAAAPLDDVLAHWSGLGYYARARNLHRAAHAIVERHEGRLPADLAALRDLPGFGPYTAGAVASIALGLDAALVDGNVARVLCRWEGWEVGAEEALTRAWALAPSLVPTGEAGDFNQALMELGATVCVPGTPRCEACPVRTECRAVLRGEPGRYPLPKLRKPRKALRIACLSLRDDDAIWLEKREAKGLFGGLWQLPSVELSEGDVASEAAGGLARNLVGPEARVTRLAAITQALTHRDVTVELFEVRGRPKTPPPGGRRVKPDELPTLGVSSLVAKVLAAAGITAPGGHGRRQRKASAGQGSLF